MLFLHCPVFSQIAIPIDPYHLDIPLTIRSVLCRELPKPQPSSQISPVANGHLSLGSITSTTRSSGPQSLKRWRTSSREIHAGQQAKSHLSPETGGLTTSPASPTFSPSRPNPRTSGPRTREVSDVSQTRRLFVVSRPNDLLSLDWTRSSTPSPTRPLYQTSLGEQKPPSCQTR